MIVPHDPSQTGNGADGDDRLPRHARSMVRALLRDLRDYAVCILDRNGFVSTWSHGARLLNGYTDEEIIGSHLSRLYPPEAVRRGAPAVELETAARTGRFEDEGWRVRKDGSRFWANVIVTSLHDEAGQLTGFLKITRDLTERRQREQQTRESEERFRMLVEGVRDYAIFTLDVGGHVTTWNAGARHIKGYEPHEIIGSHFSRFYPPEAVARHWPEHELRIATLEGRFEDEGWRVRKDGTRFWANVVITALRDHEGKLRGFSKITRDLTERRRHEEALRRSEERLRLMIEAVSEYALFMIDPRGFVSSWNSGAERILDYRAEDIIGRHVANVYRPVEVAEDAPWRELAEAAASGRLDREAWRIRRDGSHFPARTIISPLRDAQGELYGYAHLIQDLTQQRHAETLESLASRMNEFIAMLAHELRNPLAPIRNAISLMQRKGLGDPVLESMRQAIERQTITLERIVNDLLDVSRVARGKFAIERRPIDLAQVVAHAAEPYVAIAARNDQTLTLEVPAEPLPLSGDTVRLMQVVSNLLSNALKFTEPQGRITVSVTREGDEAALRVRDNGRGIAPEMLHRVFDLFVQGEEPLHRPEGGLGVGLALVRSIVQLHGGRVEAQSGGLGCGSEFIVRLPTVESLPVPKEAAAKSDGPELPRRRILLADDNADAATTLDLLLQSLGQETRVAHDGEEALELIESFRPDIVMLDIGMPKINGYDVAQRLRAARSGAVLVAITGWGQEADRQRAREAGFDHHFVKPVSEAALRRVICVSGLPEQGPG